MAKKKAPAKRRVLATKKGSKHWHPKKAKKKKPELIHVRNPRLKPRQVSIPESPSPETVTMTDIGTEKRLSTKIIVGKKIGRVEERTALFNVIGIATGLKSGQSGTGDWVGLTGEFEVVRFLDHTTLRGPLWIAPNDILAKISGQAAAYDWPVQFGVAVAAVPSQNVQGYEYDISYFIEPANVLISLRALRDFAGDR